MDKTPRYPSQSEAAASGHPCPACGDKTRRMQRRPVDRITSLWSPSRRYRCTSFSCGWEGNHALDKEAALRRGRRQRLPLSFIISMAMVAASMVFALGFATLEVVPRFLRGLAGLVAR